MVKHFFHFGEAKVKQMACKTEAFRRILKAQTRDWRGFAEI
jgi:hypothetical protein